MIRRPQSVKRWNWAMGDWQEATTTTTTSTKTKSNDYWSTDQDIEDDLFAISDFACNSPSTTIKRALPSPKVRNVRSRPSLFDADDDDDLPPRRGVRGVPVRSNVMVTPGALPSFRERTAMEIRRAVGLGYSNQITEEYFKASAKTIKDKSDSDVLLHIDFEEAPQVIENKVDVVDLTSTNSSPVELDVFAPETFDLESKVDFPQL